MYPWSFLCEEAKIKQHTFYKKDLCEINESLLQKNIIYLYKMNHFF